MSVVGQSDIERLLRVRTGLRRFLRWSERQSDAAGITPAQHQLLLAVGGHPDPSGPTIGEVADYLVLRHNSAVGLVDRAAAAGIVRRTPDPRNNRIVRLTLTAAGIGKLQALAQMHRDELAHLERMVDALRQALDRGRTTTAHGATPATADD